MTVGSCDNHTAPQGYRKVSVQCPYNGTDIKQSSSGNLKAIALVIIVWPPYDVRQYLSKLVSLSYVHMFCFTRLKCHLNKKLVYMFGTRISKNTRVSNSHRTISVRKPQGRRAISLRFLCTAAETMTARSPHGLSTALHGSVVETRQRNRTMVV